MEQVALHSSILQNLTRVTLVFLGKLFTNLSVLVESVPGVGVLDVGVGLEELVVNHALDGDLER